MLLVYVFSIFSIDGCTYRWLGGFLKYTIAYVRIYVDNTLTYSTCTYIVTNALQYHQNRNDRLPL